VPAAPASAPAKASPAQSAAQREATDALETQFEQQVRDGDVQSAVKTAEVLTKRLGKSSAIVFEIPEKLRECYLQRGRQQLLQMDPDGALDTLKAARQHYDNQELRDTQEAYALVSDEFSRLMAAASLSVDAHRVYLLGIHDKIIPDDYKSIEQMLARTLADDIADQRSKANRQPVIAALLESGRKLFPSEADLLEQGKAGELGSRQIEISNDP
jgi:hypothetical protein